MTICRCEGLAGYPEVRFDPLLSAWHPQPRAIGGDDMKRLIADFNRDWPDVTRTRETFVLAEEFAA